MTFDEALCALRAARAFEGSQYERHAIDVFENGLYAVGVPVFATLDDALADWREAYEQELREDAGLIACGAMPSDAYSLECWWARIVDTQATRPLLTRYDP